MTYMSSITKTDHNTIFTINTINTIEGQLQTLLGDDQDSSEMTDSACLKMLKTYRQDLLRLYPSAELKMLLSDEPIVERKIFQEPTEISDSSRLNLIRVCVRSLKR